MGLNSHIAIKEIAGLLSRDYLAVRFLQIGGNDGSLADPISTSVLKGKWVGRIFEPISVYFEKLSARYASLTTVECIQAAISSAAGRMSMYYVKPEYVPDDKKWMAGIASLHIEQFEGVDLPEGAIERCDVDVVPINQTLGESGPLDLLLLDVEGHERELLLSLDLTAHRPTFLIYEHKHLKNETKDAINWRLQSAGYELFKSHPDMICVQNHSLTKNVAALLADQIERGLIVPYR